MGPFSTINLLDVDAKLSFFCCWHLPGNSFCQLIGVNNVKKTTIIICNVTWCTNVSNPCVLCEQKNVPPSKVHNIPASTGIFTFSVNQTFFFIFYFSISIVSKHNIKSSSFQSTVFFLLFIIYSIFAVFTHMSFSTAIVA